MRFATKVLVLTRSAILRFLALFTEMTYRQTRSRESKGISQKENLFVPAFEIQKYKIHNELHMPDSAE